MDLKSKHPHKRDNDVILTYTPYRHYIITSEPTIAYESVTTWVEKLFPKFDADKAVNAMMNGKKWNQNHEHWGKTTEQIKDIWKNTGKEASDLGTKLHDKIERFMNGEILGNSEINADDFKLFIKFFEENPALKPYRVEWKIFNKKKKKAGCADMVYINEDGTFDIYDWKRCKPLERNNDFNEYAIHPAINHIPNTKYWKYVLQLNIYRQIFEEEYDMKISRLRVVRFYPEEKNYEIVKIPILVEELNELFL